MLQGTNGIRLKLNLSKSQKRVIQAKNIQFKGDHQIAAKFKSLQPDNARPHNNVNTNQQKDTHGKIPLIVLENLRESRADKKITFPDQDPNQFTFSKVNENFKAEQEKQLKKVHSDQGPLQLKTLASQMVYRQTADKQNDNQRTLQDQNHNLRQIEIVQPFRVNLIDEQQFTQQSTAEEIDYTQHLHNSRNQNELQLAQSKQSSQQTRKKSSHLFRNDYTPTTAASSNKGENLQSTELYDQFSGKPIQPRKKVEGRLDMVLESRGSIFSGRDEALILLQKRQIEQKDLQEALRKQIEDKKKRVHDEKQKQDVFDNQWSSPKGNRIKLISQENSDQNALSPASSQFTLYSQHPSGAHSVANLNQLMIQKYQSGKKADFNLEVLEEEKSGETTFMQIKSPTYAANTGVKSIIEIQDHSQNVFTQDKSDSALAQQIMLRSSSTNLIGTQNTKININKVQTNFHKTRLSQGGLKKKIHLLKNIQDQQESITPSSSKLSTFQLSDQVQGMPNQLQKAKVESQNQIDALSNMVEQLLEEQRSLKDKLTLQEKILEVHLHKNDDQLSSDRGSLSNRPSSREFKIRKNTSSTKLKLLSRQDSDDPRQYEEVKEPLEDEVISKNLIFNHQVQLKNQSVEKQQMNSESIQNNNSNQRYQNRQSNKMQFIERNEKLKQSNHLIKYGPTNGKQARGQSLEPLKELKEEIEKASQMNLNDFIGSQQSTERLAIAKSIDTLQKVNFNSDKLALMNQNSKHLYNSQSQENLKFSSSVKNLQAKNQLGVDLGQTQNLDFAGQSQLLFFSENKQKNSNFLPDIKKMQPQTQEMTRNQTLESLNMMGSGSYREAIHSNYKIYDNQVKVGDNNNVIQKRQKTQKSKKEELDMISSIFMPDSVIMTSLDKNQMQPILQNNLINSQKFLSSDLTQQATQQLQDRPYMQSSKLEQIDENYNSQLSKASVQSKAKQQQKKKNASRLSVLKEQVVQGNSNLRMSQQNFMKFNQNANQVNLAERLTFSNFNKDPNNNFEAIQIESQQTAQNSHFKRQNPSPTGGMSSNQRNSQGFSNPQFMVVKKSANHRLAPLALIQKKITPVKKKFPHDFFGMCGRQEDNQEE